MVSSAVSVILFVINVEAIALFKFKSQSPRPINLQTPRSGTVAFQFVQIPAGLVYVRNFLRQFHRFQTDFQAPRVIGLDTFGRTSFKKRLQAFVFEASDHVTNCN